MVRSAPSAALIPNWIPEEKPSRLDRLRACVGRAVSSVLGRGASQTVVTFDETKMENVPAVPARANESTRIAAGLHWLREYDEARYEKAEDAVVTLAAARPDISLGEYSGCEGIAKLAQEVGADLESLFATPPVAQPVRATVQETLRAYEEIFGAADRAFTGRRETRAVRIERWEAMMDAAGGEARPSFSPALEARAQDSAQAA